MSLPDKSNDNGVRGFRGAGAVWFRAECRACGFRSSPVVTSAAAHRLYSLHTREPDHQARAAALSDGRDD